MAGHLAPFGVQMPQLALQQTFPPVQIFVPHGIAISMLLLLLTGVAMVVMGVVERRRRRRRGDSLVAVRAVAVIWKRVFMVSCVKLCYAMLCWLGWLAGIRSRYDSVLVLYFSRICECTQGKQW